MVVEVAVGWLNSLLGPEIVEHQAEWDSTDKCMVPKSGDWCATAIVDEKHGFTLVLEAGETYVHIVTLVDKTHSFQAKPGTRVFVMDRYGAFAEDPSRSRPFRRIKKRALTGSFFALSFQTCRPPSQRAYPEGTDRRPP